MVTKKYQPTLLSLVISLNASVTCSAVALPPTSRKLAGVPPCSSMMSMVAMANPAPLTVDKFCKIENGQGTDQFIVYTDLLSYEN